MNIRSEAKRIKPSVIERHDGQCYVCGFACRPVLIIHHIIPVAIGGDNSLSNVVSLCPNCHAIVHKMMDFALTQDTSTMNLGTLQQGEIGKIWNWSLDLSNDQFARLYSLARLEALVFEGNNYESAY